MRYCSVTRCSVDVRRLEIHTRGWSRFAEGAASGGTRCPQPHSLRAELRITFAQERN
jgi:hypothetical protein